MLKCFISTKISQKLKFSWWVFSRLILRGPFRRGPESVHETVPREVKRCKNGAKKLPVYIWWQQCEVLVWNVRCHWQRLHNVRTVQTRWVTVHILQFYSFFIIYTFRVSKVKIYQQYNFDHHLITYEQYKQGDLPYMYYSFTVSLLWHLSTQAVPPMQAFSSFRILCHVYFLHH